MKTSEKFTPLQHTRLSPLATFSIPRRSVFKRVSLNSPALDVMTDLRRINAVTIAPEVDIVLVNHRMIAAAVRMLLVVNEQQHIQGLITASDILSEKPMQFAQRHNITVTDVTVADIMTPRDELDILRLDDVASAKVGDIVETLIRHGRQHALVSEHGSSFQQQQVRGIFSTTQISRQLGEPIAPPVLATTFAELGAALASGEKTRGQRPLPQ